MEPGVFNNGTVLPANPAANSSITTSPHPCEDNSTCTNTTGTVRTAEASHRPSLSLKRRGKRVASDGGHSEQLLVSKKPPKCTGTAGQDSPECGSWCWRAI